jgi:outer membrane receptor for ferrienterochelin and colicins
MLKITEKKRLFLTITAKLEVFVYKIQTIDLNIDYTGNVYSPMQLPLLSALDPRAPESPWYSLQNIQFIYSGLQHFEYAGIKTY